MRGWLRCQLPWRAVRCLRAPRKGKAVWDSLRVVEALPPLRMAVAVAGEYDWLRAEVADSLTAAAISRTFIPITTTSRDPRKLLRTKSSSRTQRLLPPCPLDRLPMR